MAGHARVRSKFGSLGWGRENFQWRCRIRITTLLTRVSLREEKLKKMPPYDFMVTFVEIFWNEKKSTENIRQ